MSNPKTSVQRSVLAAPSISFKRELEALRAQRRVPVLERHLAIGGGIEAAVHREVDQRRERRIGAMETRLTEIKGHAENAFAVYQLQTRACRDFERSR
jgi:hypothetical protein